jgi:hypothetical protein
MLKTVALALFGLQAYAAVILTVDDTPPTVLPSRLGNPVYPS